jgi:hypothetical protein
VLHESVLIEHLGPDGTYSEVESSRYLHVRRDEVVRWLIEEDSRNKGAWAYRLASGFRSSLNPGQVATSSNTLVLWC